jgi:hypothetical protein
MAKNTTYFHGSISRVMNDHKSAIAKPTESPLTEAQAGLTKFQNNHHNNLFTQIDELSKKFNLKYPLKLENNKPEYAGLFDFFQEQIDTQEALLSIHKNFAERYENLFNKYDEKLKNPHLTNRQRNRYQKLWTQYAMLYVQYCQN